MTKKKIYRAGVIPYIKEGDKILMMFMIPSNPKYGTNYPQIAKGKQEEDEDRRETALREASEELGLFKGNILQLDNIGEWLGRTTVFIALIKDKDMFGDPHFETKSVKWLTLEQFMKEGRSLHKPIVRAGHRRMEKVLNESFLDKCSNDLHLLNLENNKTTPMYWTSSFYELIAEAPQQIGNTTFELDNPKVNQKEAENLLNRNDKHLIEKKGNSSLYQFEDSIALINEKNKKLLYVVYFTIKYFHIINTNALIQFWVWSDKSRDTSGIAKWIFNQLLNVYHVIMTDSQHTQDGEKFWLNRIVDAFNTGLNVYFVKLNKPNIVKKINNYSELRIILKRRNVWGISDNHSQMRIVITDKIFEEIKE